MIWNNKCRFFDERYACDTLATEGYKDCNECKFAMPYSKKILIIKLGAMGDVLRTTPILEALRKRYGEDILIYWMTSLESFEVIKDNPLIDKILIYNPENLLRIQQERFDILFSLEINTPATLLANLVKADMKFGYYFDQGSTACFNIGAKAYLETAFLQHAKLQNRKTYQQLIFEACDLLYNKEKPSFNLTENEIKFAEEFMTKNNLSTNDKIIGVNIGSASRWDSKFWGIEKIKELIRKLPQGFKVILLAGPNEIEKQKKLIEDMKQEGIFLLSNNSNNALSEFAAVLYLCNIIICGDTLALHLASLLNKQVIALFFSTPSWEIEDYGTIKKIESPLLEKYFMIGDYVPELADSISVDSVITALNFNQ